MSAASLLSFPRVHPAQAPEGAPQWVFSELTGRLTEISSSTSSACLTVALDLVAQAQRARDTAAWITGGQSAFYPPDLAHWGIDLRCLPVIFAPGTKGAARAADRLLRSNGFGLVVVDLCEIEGPRSGDGVEVPMPLMSRLVKLSQHHAASVVFLTRKHRDRPSLGSLIALRGEAVRQRVKEDRFRVVVEVLKDKRRGPGWKREEVFRGPDGLR
jgi:recombination protein RecA